MVPGAPRPSHPGNKYGSLFDRYRLWQTQRRDIGFCASMRQTSKQRPGVKRRGRGAFKLVSTTLRFLTYLVKQTYQIYIIQRISTDAPRCCICKGRHVRECLRSSMRVNVSGFFAHSSSDGVFNREGKHIRCSDCNRPHVLHPHESTTYPPQANHQTTTTGGAGGG